MAKEVYLDVYAKKGNNCDLGPNVNRFKFNRPILVFLAVDVTLRPKTNAVVLDLYVLGFDVVTLITERSLTGPLYEIGPNIMRDFNVCTCILL